MQGLLDDTYVSVDIETAGPHPGRFAMLSIGACLIIDPMRSFYVELAPTSMEFVPEAMAISGLSLESLARSGVQPGHAMAAFAQWLQDELPANASPVFVAFNAAFDWMFIHEYFYRYVGHNPFGHAALDIKAYYMGMMGVPWSETSMDQVAALNPGSRPLDHNALNDAQEQARLFAALLKESSASPDPGGR